MINNVSAGRSDCKSFFLIENPEIGVVAGAFIAALGVVLYYNGIGCFTQNCAISSAGLASFVIFSVLTSSKRCLITNRIPQKTEVSTPEIPPNPPEEIPRAPQSKSQARVSDLKKDSYLTFSTHRKAFVEDLNQRIGNDELCLQKDSFGDTILHQAASSSIDSKEKVGLILLSTPPKLRKRLINAEDANGMTPLHRVVDPKAIETLVDAGANLEARDKEGRTPLLLFTQTSSLPLVQELLKWGARVDVADNNGQTSLMFSSQGNELYLKCILNAVKQRLGCTARPEFINQTDAAGETALHYAAREGSWNHIQKLCQAGAKEGLRDQERRTYRDIAAKRFENVKNELVRIHGFKEDQLADLQGLLKAIQDKALFERVKNAYEIAQKLRLL